jgi:hypothetical protein
MLLREAVICAWGLGETAYHWQFSGNLPRGSLHKGFKGVSRHVSDLGTLCRYGMFCKRMTARPKAVNVDKLVDQWIEAIVGMCTCHDKDEYDAHDAKADELLGPILTAPIAQVREFYAKMIARLKSDKRVPLIVHMGFDCWGKAMVKGAGDNRGILRLKTKLAREVAKLVELPAKEQLPKAIERALKWRDPAVLKEIKKSLESGRKPRLVGRQSCLFLEVGRGSKKKQVML